MLNKRGKLYKDNIYFNFKVEMLRIYIFGLIQGANNFYRIIGPIVATEKNLL